MYSNCAINYYNRVNINTSDPLKLVVMCYEKAIQALNQGIRHFHEQDIEKIRQVLPEVTMNTGIVLKMKWAARGEEIVHNDGNQCREAWTDAAAANPTDPGLRTVSWAVVAKRECWVSLSQGNLEQGSNVVQGELFAVA